MLLGAPPPSPLLPAEPRVQAAERSWGDIDANVADDHVKHHAELHLLLVLVPAWLEDSGVGGSEPEGDGLPEHLPVEGLQWGILLQRLEQHGPCVTKRRK